MPPDVPSAYRDPKTPDDVEIVLAAREPVRDPTLGISVPVDRAGTPRHRLVAIGDSLTHGFQSGAIFNTALSYPAIIARALGAHGSFRFPTYDGFGGLPVNIEYILREMEETVGDRIDWWETPITLFRLRSLLDAIEDHWERGSGAAPPRRTGINHNLAVYGWDLRDALSRNADICRAAIGRPRDDLFTQIVEDDMDRAAVRVLDAARDAQGRALTPFEAAAVLGRDGTDETPGSGHGIETLLVFLGANNALSAVTKLKVSWSGPDYDDPARKGAYTVWRPTHFAAEFDQVVRATEAIDARHVIFGTVPHVTIAPIARGVGGKVQPGSRYFPYYTRPWIDDARFDPDRDPHITEQQARAVDSAIDQYNAHIVARVTEARRAGRDWYVLDTCGILDRLASRRYQTDPAARPAWWYPYELPPELAALSPTPDSRFFCSDATGRTHGGLFSLDGVHPTTVAYGLLALEFATVMQHAGVTFASPGGKPHIDFADLVRRDTLIAHPPTSLSADMRLLGWLDDSLDVVSRIFGR